MARSTFIGLIAWLALFSCQSAGSRPSVELTPEVITRTLKASASKETTAQALDSNKPLLLVFWQSW